jgi:beta-lactamase class A
MMRTLGHVVHRDGIPAALPRNVWVGNKPGWIAGTRHDCAVVAGPDTAPYVLAVCTTGLPDATALALIRRFAAASWQDREVFAEGRALVVPDRVS